MCFILFLCTVSHIFTFKNYEIVTVQVGWLVPPWFELGTSGISDLD
jgi:hypothetical protein